MEEFDPLYFNLTGNAPFPWHQELYRWFVGGRIPSSCNIPTGLGKTSVIAVWLIALANHSDKMPRRLVYVVNRRTVVDQTTNEVEKIRAKLVPAGLEGRLKQLCSLPLEKDALPLAISTLRGQFADNREWSADPSRPAVICGTVDMIGSRLLFSGYGIGFKAKPLHAGFLGQDVLLVHDEAHLEPAFQDLLIAIQKEQERCKEFGSFRVMELSATSRGEGDTVTLEKPDYEHPEVRKRIAAKKAILLIENKDDKKLAEEIADLALKFKDSKTAVLVFVRKVEDVEKILTKLKKEKQKVQQLTGTLRGLERDKLVEDPIFARFLPPSNRSGDIVPTEGTVYLVCTSAGEVGVNISANHLVCDHSTFDSMAQRFGRVNRFGEREDTQIHIVYPKEFDEKNELESRLKKTLDLLKQLNGDGSPKGLGNLDPKARLAAFAPPPTILPVSDILFDAWALTTIRGKLPGRPPVEPYLHGLSSELPETYVAWREEVWELRLKFKNEEDRMEREAEERKRLAKFAAELLEDYSLKPQELLRDRSDRVFKHLFAIAERHPEHPVWLLNDEGAIEVFMLKELAIKNRKERIDYCTVLLPPDAGGLLIDDGESRGLLDGTSKYESENRRCYDVADDWKDENDQQRRVRVWDDEKTKGMRLIRPPIDTKPNAEDEEDEESTGKRFWHWYELPKEGDSDGSKSSNNPVLWDVHTKDVIDNTERIVKALGLPKELQDTIILAAKFHDLGKKRELWQQSIGNPTPTNWLGKSGGKMKPRELTNYRHEFGSLLDVLDPNQPCLAEFQTLTNGLKDVVLHLIAVHHGFGRPHFPRENAFDPAAKETDAGKLAAEIPGRFAQLQRKYGRWGLAYLESLLRAADWAASANPSAFVEEKK